MGSFDHDTALTGEDLIDYVNEELFPYLKGFRQRASSPDTIEYKIGEIFNEIKNKFQSGYSLRDALELVDQLNPGRNMGKTNSLNDDDLKEFVELQTSFADTSQAAKLSNVVVQEGDVQFMSVSEIYHELRISGGHLLSEKARCC